MKKNNFVFLLLLMFLIICSTSQVNAKISFESSSFDLHGPQLLSNIASDRKKLEAINNYMIEEYGVNYHDKLIHNQLSVNTAFAIESKLKQGEMENSSYPDYIGGLYIDNDDNLVLQVVEEKVPVLQSKQSEKYMDIIRTHDNVKINYINYSYNELNEVYSLLLEKYLGKNNNFSGLYIDIPSNRVVVELKEYNLEEIKKFKDEIINSPMIIFTESVDYENIASINPGAMYTSSTGQSCSYGYRVKTSSGQVGIVSAGHCFNSVGDTIPGIGYVSKHANNGTLDAAFIATSSGITPTNILNQSLPMGSNTISTIVEYDDFLVVGQTVAKVGYATGYTAGTIKSTNYSYAMDGVTHTNLIRATLTSEKGDSGGIAVTTNVMAGLFTNNTLGIMHAKSKTMNESLITKASVIKSQFGLDRY